MVYKFTVYCLQQIVDTYKLQVYSILNSLQQITSHWPITELLHLCTVDSLFFNELHDKLTTYFPLTLLLYSIHHAPLSQEGGGCLHLPHLSGTPPPPPIFTRFNHRKKVCVTSWALASASLILRLYERGKHESLGLLWGIFPHLFPCTSLVWLWYGVDQGYKAHLASSPGHSQILSRSHGCEIKSGNGLGTRLRLTIPTSFGIKLLHIPLRDIHERYVVMPRESLYMQTDTHCLFHCIVLCGVWSPWQQKRRMKRKKASRSTASTSSLATVSH